MLFSFLAYLHPTHYFQLQRKDGTSIFPVASELSPALKQQLEEDKDYISEEAKEYDLSWQAINKGYTGNAKTYATIEKLNVVDEYRFVKKYFNTIWLVYIFGLRLLSLKNPIQECKGFFKALKVKKVKNFNEPIIYDAWEGFQSELIARNPLVSVVIPTLNRYDYLKDVLKDLEQQDYKNFEVIVVDQSEPFQPEFYKDYNLNFNIIHQEDKALWQARNRAITNSKGEFIALSEDDVRIESDWITNHLKCLDFFNASISAGVFYPLNGSIPKARSFFSTASQFATGNSVLYKTVFEAIGLFDLQFEAQRMGDGEFGARAFINSFKSVSNPLAACVDVKASTGGLRQMGSWDSFRPKGWLSPRPIPSVLYFFRRYFGKRNTKLVLLKAVPSSVIPYRFKRNRIMLLIGSLLSILISPLVLYQVLKSWSLSSRKIKQGPMISNLD